jgi:hypothetical protein
MGLIRFTANHTDHCNNNGYQFEFHCDKCGNGFTSTFQASKVGMAGGFLRAAGSLFGSGALNNLAGAGDYLQDATRCQGRDAAFAKAVEEARPHFRQCSRCGKWVCPENCWNHKKNMCEECAPNLEKEAAAIQNQAAVDQIRTAAYSSDQIRGEVDVVHDVVTNQAAATCPHCNANTQGSKKFCPECGKPLSTRTNCPQCQAKLEAGTKFCGECGTKVV